MGDDILGRLFLAGHFGGKRSPPLHFRTVSLSYFLFQQIRS